MALAKGALDLAAAEDTAANHPRVARFLCQQAAEKAVKALLDARGEERRTGHSITALLVRLPGSQERVAAADALALDLLYQTTRYPGAVPGWVVTVHQAPEALERARRTVGDASRSSTG